VRNTITLVVAVFLVVGVFGWIAGMPKASDAVPYAFAEVAAGQPQGQARTPVDPETGFAQPTGSPLVDGAIPSTTDGVVSTDWLTTTATSTGIPVRALQAYTVAALTLATRAPDCHLGWNTLAAIGEVESQHGTHGGAHIDASGQLAGTILGPRLDGSQYEEVPDTDGGRLDGDAEYDRAVGPLQFVPDTWAAYGEDGSGDGKADPNQIDDAALTAGVYLCTAGQDLSADAGWTAAVQAYNHDDAYIASVRKQSNDYAALAAS
jgi:membrane-bound lytic murein transglycosylase B